VSWDTAGACIVYLIGSSRAILERKDTKKSAETATTDVEIVDVSRSSIVLISDAHLNPSEEG
jgi:hypothetical protein